MAGTSSPVIRNAMRLLDDAYSLRQAKKYPSAAGLGVLSMEEVGKFLYWHQSLQGSFSDADTIARKTKPSHIAKQRAVAKLLIGNLLINEIEYLISFAARKNELILFDGAEGTSNLVDVLSSIDKRKLIPNSNKYAKNYKHHRYLVDMAAGRLDRLKQDCFYVDRDSSKTWIDASVRVDRYAADKVLKLSQTALNETYRRLSSHNRAAELRKRHRAG